MSLQRSITVLFFGDVIGKPGRTIIKRYLAEAAKKVDLVIANVENAAHGFGITKDNLSELKEAGVKVFTGGNHIFDRKEIFDFIGDETNFIRPANYPPGTPGQGTCLVEMPNCKIAIVNLLGRVFMEPLLSPFTVADQLIPALQEKAKIILVDVHAEATAEKVALGWYLDGRVTAVLGTHTHVQTADERILPQGTAYITDVGCCGPYNGVIGMEQQGVFRRLINQLPSRLEVAAGPARLSGVYLEIDPETGKATAIERLSYLPDH